MATCGRPGCGHSDADHFHGAGRCCVKPPHHCESFVGTPSGGGSAPTLGAAEESDTAAGLSGVVGGGGGGTSRAVTKGTFSRDGLTPAGQGVVPTMKLEWSTMEGTQGVRDYSVITDAMTTAVSRGYPGIRLRIAMGAYAPTWAKNFANGPINYVVPENNQTVQIPDLWDTVDYQPAVADFFADLAATLDDDDRLLAIFTTGAMTYYGEPCLRGGSSSTTRNNLLAAGYTIAKDMTLQHAALHWMEPFVLTPVGLSYNPMQKITSGGALQTDVAETISLMDDHRATFGQRTILQNNSVRHKTGWPPAPYQTMYDEMIAQSSAHHTQYQIAGAQQVGNNTLAMEYTIDTLKADGAELVNGYQNLSTAAQRADWDARLKANGP